MQRDDEERFARTVRAALERRRPEPSAGFEEALLTVASGRPRPAVLALVLAGLVVVGVGGALWQLWREPPSPPAASGGPREVRANPAAVVPDPAQGPDATVSAPPSSSGPTGPGPKGDGPASGGPTDPGPTGGPHDPGRH